MVHPNVIGIFDIGEFEEDGTKSRLRDAVASRPDARRAGSRGSHRLTIENVIDIFDQAITGGCTPVTNTA